MPIQGLPVVMKESKTVEKVQKRIIRNFYCHAFYLELNGSMYNIERTRGVKYDSEMLQFEHGIFSRLSKVTLNL